MSLSLLLIAFLAGILTILAPCVLPLLPVIIGGSLNKENLKPPYLIIASLCLSIVIFTLLLKTGVATLGLNPNTLKAISATLLLLLGLVTIFPHAWEKIAFKLGLSNKSNQFLDQASHQRGAAKDILTGVALGPVFSSCSPTYFLILATVLPTNFFNGVIALLVYSLGLSLSLFAVSFLGQKLIKKLKWATNPEGWFKKMLGILFILVALAIYTGVDKKIEIAILDSGFFDVTQIENKLLESTDSSSKQTENENSTTTDSEKADSNDLSYQSLPDYIDFTEPDGFLNSEEFTLSEYIGEKIILVEFMTYDCINCQRTFPYFNDWHSKYKDEGLLIVGIHTPEFDHERNINNVRNALADYNIEFPVVLDNDKQIWRSYQNRFWPRRYLIDQNGKIIFDHIGEGKYQETETRIQEEIAKLAV
jgi:cytochrome c biogenesis protein CcdA/thiol-disulfide isomerase/thioredoxin